MFASKHTRVEIPSKSIPTLSKNLRFSASSHSIHEKVFPAKYHKVGKGLEKVVHSASKTKKKKFAQKLFTKHYFPAVMNNHTPKQRSSGDFAFTFPPLFESGNYVGEKSFITVVSEANCGFILMGDFFDETEMYDTTNKRSFHLSES